MATDTVYGITGQSKQDIGWTTIPTVSEAGTYTLHKAYTEGERTFFKVASPYSADEYFVFEYKNKPSNNMAVDGHIASSGLIVYRVNTAFGEKSNKYKDDSGNYKDYLYVFRPGETDIHASAGNIQEAMMVAPNWSYSNATAKHSSFGSATMTDGIEAGAITDSLNRNSGITVNVTAQDSTSVTFDLSIPDYADVDLWKQATATDGTGATYAVNGTGTVDVASDESGGAYLLTNNGKLEVRHFTGAQWKSLGNPTTATSLGCAQIECVDGVPYCLVANYPGGSSNSVQLLAYKNGAWSTVGSVSTGASCSNAATLSVSGGDLFVVVDKDNANSKVYKLGSSGLQALGAELDSSFLLAPVVFVVDGTTYVAYGDFPLGFGSTASGLHVDKLVGNTWQEVYQGGSTNARGKAVAVYHDNAIPGSGCNAALILSTSDVDVAPTLYKVTASGVSLVTAFPEYASSNNGLGLCIKGDNAYLLFAQGAETPAAEVLTASLDDLTAWTKLGETVASPSDSAAMAISGNSVFVASQNRATEKATLYSHAVMESEPPAPQPVDIAGATIASIPDQTVTGSEIKPALTVTIDGSTLNEGTDYTVVYTGNIAVGTATATITGINDYTGTKSATFKIVAAAPPITKIDKPTAKTGLVYNGSAQTAVAAATAYTVTNGAATNAGNYTATAKLKDKTTTAWSDGTTDDVSISYTIAKKSITKPTAKTGLVYNGSSQTGVAAATGYTVTNGAATNAGNYTATAALTDKTNTQWSGTTSSDNQSIGYSIAKANLSAALVSAQSCTYTGADLEPTPTVVLNGKTLPASDYSVSFSDNRNVGTAKIIVTGTGNYAGTANGTFEIVAAAPPITKIDKPTAKTGLVYNGSTQTAVDAATAYTVENGAATNAGTYTATAKLKDKTTTAWSDGTTDDVSISYTIAKESITKPTAKTGLVYNGSKQTGVAAAAPGYKVTNGIATNAGTYTATAALVDAANTQWAGTTSSANLSLKYTIAKANISKAFVSAPTCTYTGSALKPAPTVTLNKKLLPKSAYTVAYANNRNVGTAKITITGTGNYTGTATGTFAIKQCATQKIYRLYNPGLGEHLYTTDANEMKVLSTKHGWKYEGVAWNAPTKALPGAKPVYRLYNAGLATHLYTTDTNEVNTLCSKWGWVKDFNGAPLFYSGGTIGITRLYNPGLAQHHYTADANEIKTITQPKWGWKGEGTKLYCVSKG